ncbi:aspartyl protease family protein [Dyadobacter sp. LHD-138]|uniref:aspartyl protease family protein n=1 Tax=Dyadobacter sp. LHD-138 TaxID=3071413 RepID=UPI0027DF1389|nr:aspartyl protease family protein [Dyadobacter sp. LHD-138]MDQ6480980.1 aspartyl protease family protein [Dyadobacter sp. LHD-138]
MKTFIWLLLISTLFISEAARAASVDGTDNADEKYGYFLDKNHKTARIPFELHSNLILVYARINDVDSLRFILDTGVSSIIITDPNILRPDKLRLTRKINLSGAGEGKSIAAHVAIDNRFAMGRLRANHQNIVVIEQDFLRLSEYVGVPVHGIFGYDIFNNFVVTIDFSRRELLLTQNGNYKYKPSKGDKHPIIIEDTKPFTDAVTLFADGREKPIRVLIDTGAGHALLLNNTPKETYRLPEKVIRAQLGRGLNGVINGNLARVDKMKLGRFELDNIVASFPDSAGFSAKMGANVERQGNIGCELLRRFKVTMNYHEGYMVLKPVRSRLREKFEHDMSGMEIRAEGSDLHSYFINHVQEKSPASLAGLLEGDQLLFIDDHAAAELNVSEIYKLMQRGDGRNIDLLVKRNGNIFFTRITLRRMI